ncbi:response regulator [Burkholderia pseudomallei MSHR684]|nr:response regulator [Burkholderia pseudomallei MSHR684]
MSDKNFLVIDDNEVFAGTLARGLERRGYAVRQAHNKDEALKLAGAEKFEFITRRSAPRQRFGPEPHRAAVRSAA